MGTHLPTERGTVAPTFRPAALARILAGRILPITRIVELTRQCAAGGYRGNPTGIATRLVSF